jgi:hypothetical protein
VRCNEEVEVQRRRWTFYETIKIGVFRILQEMTAKMKRMDARDD